MTTKQDSITQAIIQSDIEVAETVVQGTMVARAQANTGHRNEAASMKPKISGPSLR